MAVWHRAQTLALADQASQVNQVLIPSPTAAAPTSPGPPGGPPRLLVTDYFQLAQNVPVANGYTETCTEPSFVQVDGTVICVVRHERNKPATSTTPAESIPIYNSGSGDQANPSSVEVWPGRWFTLAYNAKSYAASEGPGVSPHGGSLWIMQTVESDY